MKYSVYETNSDGTQKFSDVRIVDAWTAQQAATKYPDQFQLDKSATHLWVRSEDRNLELFSIQPKHVSNAKTGLSKYSIVYS